MQTVILDLSRKNVIAPIHAKQGDVGRKFKAVLTDAGMVYTIPRGAQFSVWYSGHGGQGNYSAIGDVSAFTVEGNAVTVELIAQMLTNAGTGTMCLVLSGTDGSQIGMWNISYVVEAVPGMGSEEAKQHYTALSEVAEKAVRAAETFQTDPTLKISGRAADAEATGVALAGKAPAGYGLGTHSSYFDFNNVDSITKNGWYCFATSGITLAGHFFGQGIMEVCCYDENTVRQVIHPAGNLSIEIVRQRVGRTWLDWEITNPPMELGVEYRTTERYLGKPVYAKAVNFGTLAPANASVAHGIANIENVVSKSLTGQYGSELSTSERVTHFSISTTSIDIDVDATLNQTAAVIMKYTKTTD